MRVDPNKSRYQEDRQARTEFSRPEMRRLRYLLRRLRFLEAKVEENGGMDSADSSGGAHAEWEMEALEWILTDVGFLETRETGRTRR